MSSNTAVYGLYKDRGGVEEAVESLKHAGFRNTDISVLFPDNQGSKDFAVDKSTKAPEAAVVGAGSGAVVGGALAWLAGIGALAIPGVGPFIAAGPIVALLAGIGAGGTLGTMIGGLVGMGTGLLALLLATAISLVVIAVAWIIFRPLLGILLLAAAISTLIAIKGHLRKSPAAVAEPVKPA